MKPGVIVVFLIAALCTAGAQAQSFPNRPVRIIVPQPAGGLTDTLGRALGQRLSESWSQPVVVENRAGGNTIIAAELVAKATPDGYTLLLTSDTTHTALPFLYTRLPFDPQKDFAPVTVLVRTNEILVAPSTLPAESLAEFIALAKSRPGTLNYASFGNGSPPHLSMELFKNEAVISLVHVPYKGVAPAIADMVGGHVQVMFASISAPLPHIRSGKLRALAFAGPRRSRLLPDVPTFLELGYPDFQSGAWFGIVAPAGTPPAVIRRLAGDMAGIVRDRDFSDKFITGVGLEPVGNTPEQFAEFLIADRERVGKKVKVSGARLD